VEIGRKIRRLRQEKLLTQDELASRCELSKGFISQLERDLASPSIATLIGILEVLGTNLKNFFNEEEEEKIVFSKEDTYEVRDEAYGYKIDWIVPNAQKNQMEPILLTLERDGKYKEEAAHEGEEFGHVISGSVYIHIGNKKYRAKKGESFYYKPKYNHYLSNAGRTAAKVLWVCTPPSF
jgi:transcriptional regulator with XRE-family HTH domain